MTAVTFAWSDSLALAYEPMDGVHREFVDHVDALLTCPDAELPQRMRDFVAHTQTHFAEEQALMASAAFPPMPCHEREHTAVLKSAAEVLKRVEAGDVDIARALARALADWFPEHASYMDAALARWMVNLGKSAQPVELPSQSHVCAVPT